MRAIGTGDPAGVPRIRFCATCGTPFDLRDYEGRQRPFCPRCRRICYRQLKVGAGALIERDQTLLLVQRTTAPFRHSWNLPAGYAEADENPTRTVVREVHEETGLQVEVEALVDVYFFDDDPRGNGIFIVYSCRVTDGDLVESSEAVNPTFFRRENLPEDLAGGAHDQAVRAWRASCP